MRKAMLFVSAAGLAAVLLSLVPARAVWAEDLPVADADLLQRLFSGGPIPEEWVAPVAREQLPPELLHGIATQLRAAAGALERVDPVGDEWRLTYERMTAMVVLVRDADRLITGLFVRQPVPRAQTVDDAAEAITSLAGDTSLLVLHGERTLYDHQGDRPMLVGSAFKLAVLAALREAIDAGEFNWVDVVTIDDDHRSLPSGVLQDFPADHPLTVATLATLMVSVSDNTATDMLMGLLGEERLEAAAGIAPLLSTLDYFRLKADPELFEQYLAADLDQQREIVSGLTDTSAPTVADTSNTNVEHGWRLSAETLCALMLQVADLDLMTVNPGGLPQGDWDRVAYKGGSDIGVMNMTYLLERDGDDPYCVSATRNSEGAIDEAEFAVLVASVVAVIADATDD